MRVCDTANRGKAQVFRKEKIDDHFGNVILATLERGESIGLSDKSLFSPHEKRTATVTALTEMLLLRIDLQSFINFLKSHPNFNNEIYKIIEQLVKLDFIKKTYPFIHLTNQEISEIVTKMEKINFPPHTMIFKQGDPAECCYLLLNGKIEIFLFENGVKKSLSILEAPHIFGEAALLTSGLRNASVQTIEDSEVLIINRSLLLDTVKNSKEFAQSLIGFTLNRFRPTHCKNVIAHQHTTKDGALIAMLHNTALHQYYHLNEEGWFIWQQLDGIQTIKELTVAFFRKYKAFVPEMICNLLYSWAEMGFVNIPLVNTQLLHDQKHINFWSHIKNKVQRFSQFEFSFIHTDKWLTQLYQKGIFIFYSWPIKLFLFAFIITGFFVFINSYHRVLQSVTSLDLNFWNFLFMLIPMSMITVILHEAGHALTAKSFGYNVQRMGIGWFGLGPIAFVDTSELWIANRKTRIGVNIAGIFMDVLVASSLAILSRYLAGGGFSVYLWLLSLLVYFNAYKNLSPVREFDGYLLLSDILNYSQLRRKSIHWAANIFPNLFNEQNMLKKYKIEISYWLICLIYMVITSYLIFLILQIFLTFFLVQSVLGLSTFQFSMIFSLTIFFLSIISIWRVIRKYRENLR